MERHIVIIGGGIAGLSAAEAAREYDPQVEISLVAGEIYLPYYRPRICELTKNFNPEDLAVYDDQWYKDHRINLIRLRATSVSQSLRQVKFVDGSSVDYSQLVLATGAKGKLPDMFTEMPTDSVALRDLADIRFICEHHGPVVIVGGGLLGLECAWALSCTGRPVVVVEHERWLLSRQLDQESGIFLLSLVELAGVRVALRGNIEYIENGLAVLTDGRGYETGLTVFAAGIVPRFEVGRTLGLIHDKGIIVDDRMRTSTENVLACGDCAEYLGRLCGNWSCAREMGRIAGIVAAGGDENFKWLADDFVMHGFGVTVLSLGDYHNAAESVVKKNLPDKKMIKLFFDKDQRLCAVNLIGDFPDLSSWRRAINDRMEKDAAKGLLADYFDPKPKQGDPSIYVCPLCGYVYDPAEHDNVPFSSLEDDWSCPMCGAEKASFTPVK